MGKNFSPFLEVMVLYKFEIVLPLTYSAVLLGFLLQYAVEVMSHILPAPTESYFQVLLMSIYDIEVRQNLSCNILQD